MSSSLEPHLADLRPLSRGIMMVPRPQSAIERNASRNSRQTSIRSESSTSVKSVPDDKLSVGDVEKIIRQRTLEKQDDLRRAFQAYDAEGNMTVTAGEFHRVIETFLLPLTQSQFEAVLSKVPKKVNGTIPYMEFLGKYCRPSTVISRRSSSKATQSMTLGDIQWRLKEKIASNLKNITRAFRLFDYNQDGQIQQHELRRVLESYCFPMTSKEFSKLWSHYSPNNSNTLAYKEFLEKLGLSCERLRKALPESTQLVLNWEAVHQDQQKQLRNTTHVTATANPSVEGLTLDEIQVIFQKKMQLNYENIRRALLAFDVTQSGFVSLEDLQSVLSNFLFAMSEATFQGLMNRFGFKAMGRIAWDQFLTKFRGTVAEGNGQTLPMRPTHRVNPVLGVYEPPSTGHILKTLQHHVQAAYPSLKKAFLVFDDNRDGKITRAEMRRIVESLTFRLTDEQFKELMILLDPEHTGVISYHHFLELFEMKETLEGHKWLNGRKETQQTKEPEHVPFAWEAVEGLLRDKLTDQLQRVKEALGHPHSTAMGTVSREKLREVLHTYGLPVSDDHFHKLCQPCIDPASGGVAYRQFLQNLGVPLPSEDSVVSEAAGKNEGRKSRGSSIRTKQPKKEQVNHPKSRAVEEIIMKKLNEHLAQREITIQECLQTSRKEPSGRVSKRDLRKVLNDCRIILDDKQFQMLTDTLGFRNGGLPDSKFFARVEGHRATSANTTLRCSSAHGVNGKQVHYITAEQCISQLKDNMNEKFENLYAAFRQMDRNRDGIVTMRDFRDLFDSFTFIIKEKEYQRMMGLLGLQPGSTLNYPEFLLLFQKPEGQPWLDSVHRPNQTLQASPDLVCEQVHSYLVKKVQSRWHDLAKAFCEFDQAGQGIIRKKDLRAVLYRFALPITPCEFEKLWSRYDEEGKGFLSHAEFLETVGVEFAPADNGPSKRIVEENYSTLLEHQSKQQQKHMEIADKQAHQTHMLQTAQLEQEIKDIIRDYYQDFSTAFTKLDMNKDGYVTVQDLHRVLQDHSYQVEEVQFVHLLNRLGINTDDSKLSYFDFLRAFDDGRASKYGPRTQPTDPTESCVGLSPEKALFKIKQTVRASYDTLQKAFAAFDKSGSGAVPTLEFRQVLDNFCVKLSDRQFRYLLSKVKLNEDRTIDWKDFLNSFNFLNHETSEWLEEVQKVSRPVQTPTRTLSMKDILSRIQEVVSTRIYTISQEIIDMDYAHINVISKEDFRQICNRHFMRLKDDQFENLWNQMPVNDFGNLDYQQFLKRFSGEPCKKRPSSSGRESPMKTPSPSALERTLSPSRRPKTASCLGSPSKSVDSTKRPATAGGQATPLLNCEPIEQKVKKNIYKSWREIQKKCRELDSEGLGEISVSRFLAVLENCDIQMTQGEFEQLAQKYDIKNNGKFSYPEFLRHFVLTLKPLERARVHQPQTPMTPGTPSSQFVDSMLRLQGQVLQAWRPLRQSFTSCDRSRTGYIPLQDFKKVLRQHSVNLSEEEFFHFAAFFDKKMTGKISYNDFLRVFLR
ncbi:EFCB6 protein, partial [Amia calva]|nr:EFCB6 protein [Amia calva]